MPRPAPPLALAALACLMGANAGAQALPGTTPWENRGDAAAAMVAGMHRFVDRELAESVARRQVHWKRDVGSPAAYEASIAGNRKHLRTILGAVGERVAPVVLSYVATYDAP